MSKKSYNETIKNENTEPKDIVFEDKKTELRKYMYKPLRKGVYAKIKFVQSIFDENKSKGWLDSEPKNETII